MIKLKELMHGGVDRLPPALAACHYDEFSGKQRKLASFFGRKATATPRSPSIEIASTYGAKTSVEPTQNGNATASGREAATADATQLTAEGDAEGSSLADALFSLHSQQEGFDVERSQTAGGTTSASEQLTSRETKPIPSASAPVAPTSTLPSSPVRTAASQPSPNGKRDAASPKRTPSATKGSSAKAKQTASLKGQTSLSSFFAQPKAPRPPNPKTTPQPTLQPCPSSITKARPSQIPLRSLAHPPPPPPTTYLNSTTPSPPPHLPQSSNPLPRASTPPSHGARSSARCPRRSVGTMPNRAAHGRSTNRVPTTDVSSGCAIDPSGLGTRSRGGQRGMSIRSIGVTFSCGIAMCAPKRGGGGSGGEVLRRGREGEGDKEREGGWRRG